MSDNDPTNADILAVVTELKDSFARVENLVELISSQVEPTIEAIRKSPYLKILGVKL